MAVHRLSVRGDRGYFKEQSGACPASQSINRVSYQRSSLFFFGTTEYRGYCAAALQGHSSYGRYSKSPIQTGVRLTLGAKVARNRGAIYRTEKALSASRSSTRNVEEFLRKTAISCHQNSAFLLEFGQYAIAVFFKKYFYIANT